MVTKVDVPVVSVGNLTLGGTGKTPMVHWVARWFLDRGLRVALVSRGYGATAEGVNDEALELAQRLPGVPHLLDRDRVRGARQAIAQHDCQVIILDDAFQHRRIARDFDIVLVDALEPFGFGHVFPRGTLREPLSGWSRAGAIVLTRGELADGSLRQQVRSEAARYSPGAVWCETTFQLDALRSTDGQELPLDHLKDRRVVAFCGIGNPAGFRHALSNCGYDVAEMREFADHHSYTPPELTELSQWAKSKAAVAVLCTQKDLVKITSRWPGEVPLYALRGNIRFLAGQSELESKLASVLSP